MQPIYVTLTSSVAGPWKTVNWHQTLSQQLSWAIINGGTSASSFALNVTYEDPTGVFPSPQANGGVTTPASAYQAGLTSFTLLSGSSTQFITLPSSWAPISAWQLLCNASTGAKLTAVFREQGIG